MLQTAEVTLALNLCIMTFLLLAYMCAHMAFVFVWNATKLGRRARGTSIQPEVSGSLLTAADDLYAIKISEEQDSRGFSLTLLANVSH